MNIYESINIRWDSKKKQNKKTRYVLPQQLTTTV